MSWCTIESDPGVFSELISLFGVIDVSVNEVYSLDHLVESSSSSNVSLGLIFLFKYVQERDTRAVINPSDIPELFFAKQVVQNACATQAILAVLLNSESINLPSTLVHLKEFTQGIDADSKGLAIGSLDDIRLAHNSFARPEPIFHEESSGKRQKVADDQYHFIAYIPHQGHVYEIDGLRAGPILLGDIESGDGNWLAVAKPAIEARMRRYSAAETHFALMSVGSKRSTVLEREISSLQQQLEALNMTDDSLSSQLQQLQFELSEEYEKEKRQKEENIRRRHNYIPFILTVIKALARAHKLQDLRGAAAERITR